VLLALLADSEAIAQGAAAGWVGFGVAVVALIGGLIKAIWDKDNAIKITKLELKTESQAEKLTEQGKKLDDCEKRHKECEEKGEIRDSRIDSLEALHGPGRCVPIDPDANQSKRMS
jgi:hypothetical protein